MKNLKMIIHWLGPLGSVTLCVLIILLMHLAIKNIGNMLGGVFDPKLSYSIDTSIVGIKEVNLLKPYRVITAGFSEAKYAIGDKEAVLKYQYKGMAEYSVDLSTLKCVKNDGNLELELCEPVLEKPIMINIPDPRMWDVTAPFGKSGVCNEWFRNEEGKIIDKQIRADVDTEENCQKAKQQTEDILRYLLLPHIQDASRIQFRWRAKKN